MDESYWIFETMKASMVTTQEKLNWTKYENLLTADLFWTSKTE